MIKTLKLKNGITAVIEPLKAFHSTAIGVWVKTGSAFETETENGISHVIEHMLFKGTKNRSAKQIAIELDRIGGQMNAFTSKECTCYYARVAHDQIHVAADVLSDLVKNALFDPAELDKERLVVLEEISMLNDQPDDLAHEQVSIDFFRGSTYSKPVIGPAENVRRFQREDIIRYIEKHYYPENIVISIAGKIDEAQIQALLEQYFGDFDNTAEAHEPAPFADTFIPDKTITVIKRDIEQTHISLGFSGVDYRDDARYAYSVLSNLFGGSMSSRLFQKIREEMGLVYTVYSYLSTYTEAGMFGIYAATGAKTAEIALSTIMDEVKRLKSNGVEQEEFNNSKTQIHGNYLLGLESVSSRMQSIGKAQLLLGHVDTQEEILQKLEAVTMDDMAEIIEQIFSFDSMNAAFIGSISDEKQLKALCQ